MISSFGLPQGAVVVTGLGIFGKNQFSAEVLTIRVGFIQTVQQELYGV